MAIPLWLAAILGSTGVFLARVDYNLFFMKFFRNLSRSKARARLHGNKFAMIPVMLGIEEPMKIKDDDVYAENVMTVTREQLEGMDGFDGAPLYLSIRGRVYDVSAGAKFYGEGGEYSDWVGRDASRSFGTGCRGGVDRTGMDCLSESLEGLTSAVRRSRPYFIYRGRKAALNRFPPSSVFHLTRRLLRSPVLTFVLHMHRSHHIVRRRS